MLNGDWILLMPDFLEIDGWEITLSDSSGALVFRVNFSISLFDRKEKYGISVALPLSYLLDYSIEWCVRFFNYHLANALYQLNQDGYQIL